MLWIWFHDNLYECSIAQQHRHPFAFWLSICEPTLIIIMCRVMLSKWLIGLGWNVERVSRMCDVNAFQFSTDQVKMILTLVKSVIRTQNNIKSNRKMHFVKVIIVLILPFGQGEFLIRTIVKYEPYSMTLMQYYQLNYFQGAISTAGWLGKLSPDEFMECLLSPVKPPPMKRNGFPRIPSKRTWFTEDEIKAYGNGMTTYEWCMLWIPL